MQDYSLIVPDLSEKLLGRGWARGSLASRRAGPDAAAGKTVLSLEEWKSRSEGRQG